jgi:hypothetical protein
VACGGPLKRLSWEGKHEEMLFMYPVAVVTGFSVSLQQSLWYWSSLFLTTVVTAGSFAFSHDSLYCG